MVSQLENSLQDPLAGWLAGWLSCQNNNDDKSRPSGRPGSFRLNGHAQWGRHSSGLATTGHQDGQGQIGAAIQLGGSSIINGNIRQRRPF